MNRIRRTLAWLRKIWDEMDPSIVYPPPEPALRRLDADKMEFSWQGEPFIFNKTTASIARGGKRVGRFADVRCITIYESRGDDDWTWSVFIQFEYAPKVLVGRTTIDVYASIAAANIATVMKKTVQAM